MKRSGWFYYSWVVWVMAVLSAVAANFTGMQSGFALVLFLIMPEWFMLIHTANREKLTQYEILQSCPKSCRRICAGCLAYGILNFLLGMFLLRDGGPHIHEGVYCLWNHGFIREITEQEYMSMLKTEGRMFTGNFLIFASVAMAYFTSREKIHQQYKECDVL